MQCGPPSAVPRWRIASLGYLPIIRSWCHASIRCTVLSVQRVRSLSVSCCGCFLDTFRLRHISCQVLSMSCPIICPVPRWRYRWYIVVCSHGSSYTFALLWIASLPLPTRSFRCFTHSHRTSQPSESIVFAPPTGHRWALTGPPPSSWTSITVKVSKDCLHHFIIYRI